MLDYNSIEIFHITDIDNLEKIVSCDKLFSKSFLTCNSNDYIDIAYEGIQDRRSHTMVPFSPYGNLHQYVPFYFCPRSPMLYAIHKNNVPQYPKGEESIIHIVTSIAKIIEFDRPFIFTDGHAVMKLSDFYENISELDILDWEVINNNYWADTEDDNDRKRRKQAEFLVYEFLPFFAIQKIGVYNNIIEKKVREIVKTHPQYSLQIEIRPEWYY
ncbi:MAG: DUF4433 domain-containing protein [Brevinematales bacterium]|nr:DUF4433 domain-containing protein [Brevinematales bacterium]